MARDHNWAEETGTQNAGSGDRPAFDWNAAQADWRGAWIGPHPPPRGRGPVRPVLPAFLRGEYQAPGQRRATCVVGTCQFQGHCHAAARLYADAFAIDPALDEDLALVCRSQAALGDKQPVGRMEELAAPNAVTPPSGARRPWPAADSARMGPSSTRRSGHAGAGRVRAVAGRPGLCGPRRWTVVPEPPVILSGKCSHWEVDRGA